VSQTLDSLAQQAAAGDDASMRELLVQAQKAVFSLCFKMLRRKEDAEDVAQEALIRVARHLPDWDRERPVMPWILAIAANRCRSFASKKKVNTQAIVPETIAAPENASQRNELGEELDQALMVLKDDQKECFILFYMNELSLLDISEILGKPVGTLKTWLFRARKQLAEHLQRRGYSFEVQHELQ
jgi:RNA polymerase sigma-70 factor (ECF subfamily)